MIKREAVLFLFVGSATVLTDLLCYNLLLWLNFSSVNLAKGLGFLAGLAFSYAANKKLTFAHTQHETGSLPRYLILYSITLGVNVIVNAIALHGLQNWSEVVTLAFIIATGASASLNFLGMKFFVFRITQVGKDP